MAHDIFISYSSQDKPIADAVCATLESHNMRCWIAPRDIIAGVDWSDAIIDAITECRLFILILSSSSNLSEQVKREVQNAVSEGKPILPFRIEAVDLSKHMRYFIGTPHWLDALTPPMELHLARMVQTVGALMTTIDEKGVDHPFIGNQIEAQAVQTQEESSISQERKLNIDTGVSQERKLNIDTGVSQARKLNIELNDKLEDMLSITPDAPKITIPEPVMDTACKRLAAFIGPLAKVLVKKSARDASSVDDFYIRLSEHLTNPKEKDEFLKNAGK